MSARFSPNFPPQRSGLDPPGERDLESYSEDARTKKKARTAEETFMTVCDVADAQWAMSETRPPYFLESRSPYLSHFYPGHFPRHLLHQQMPSRFYPHQYGQFPHHLVHQQNPSPSLVPSVRGAAAFGPYPVGIPHPTMGIPRSQMHGLVNAMAYPPGRASDMAALASSPGHRPAAFSAVPELPHRGSVPRLVSQETITNNTAVERESLPARSSSDRSPPSMDAAGRFVDDSHHHGHYTKRVCIDMSIDQDANWLSELQCFTRKYLLEVCWASREDVAVRNASKKVQLDQVGFRCRYCAHKPPGSRAQRSSAFPSSIPQLYQSFTMMLRDHFEACDCIPSDIKTKYLTLKSATCQGATEAKKYWEYSAAKLGMVDTEDGIIMNEVTRAAAESIPAFGAVPCEIAAPEAPEGGAVLLVKSEDIQVASGFLYTLVSHFQRIELLASERKGNRKGLRLGLPGFGCRYCTMAGRFGMSRIFPARRRTLPVRIADMYDHICRCNLCPQDSKMILRKLREEEGHEYSMEKKFLDVVWERLGYD